MFGICRHGKTPCRYERSGTCRAGESCEFCHLCKAVESVGSFFEFHERYIDEIGKPFDEFHIHEKTIKKKLYIHIDIAVQIAVQKNYIKQSCEGQFL